MTTDHCSQLLQFLRANGNVLLVSIRPGSLCSLYKRYERVDSRGEGVGRPVLELTVNQQRIAESAALLGTSVLPGKDGKIYVLEAETIVISPDGIRIDRYMGVGTGLYRIRPERGYVCRLPDGGFVLAPTEAGVRRKVANAARLAKAS